MIWVYVSLSVGQQNCYRRFAAFCRAKGSTYYNYDTMKTLNKHIIIIKFKLHRKSHSHTKLLSGIVHRYFAIGNDWFIFFFPTQSRLLFYYLIFFTWNKYDLPNNTQFSFFNQYFHYFFFNICLFKGSLFIIKMNFYHVFLIV